MVACLCSHILLYLVSFSYVFELGASQAAHFTSGQLPRRGKEETQSGREGIREW